MTPAEVARALADLLDRSGYLRLEIVRGSGGRHSGYCVTAGPDGRPKESFHIRDVLEIATVKAVADGDDTHHRA